MSTSGSNPEATNKIDEMVNLLGAAAIGENAEQVSSFENLYKNRGRCGNQDERRRFILETQKCKREMNLDRFRGVFNLVKATEDNVFETPKTRWNPRSHVPGFTSNSSNYSDVLMMSEWMYSKPTDFEENWYVVPCPKGTRMIVVAQMGTTKCFNKYGRFNFECRTALPGGNRCQNQKSKFLVVLDGFYSKESMTMHVLDILAWNDLRLMQWECSFRDYWLRSQLAEIKELQSITKINQMIFKIIPKLPCNIQSLNETLMTFPYYNHNIPPVDGLLFFHKNAEYHSGETPLVGWLYPFMVKEVLGDYIQVHPGYMLDRPVVYTNYTDFIEEFENKNKRKWQRKIFGSKNMETGENIVQGDTNSETENMEADANAGENMEAVASDNATAGSTNGNAEAGVLLTNEEQDTKSETEQMEADANAGENMEAVASGNATAGSTNGNAEAGVELDNAGGGDGEFGPKVKSKTENMDVKVADLVHEKGVN